MRQRGGLAVGAVDLPSLDDAVSAEQLRPKKGEVGCMEELTRARRISRCMRDSDRHRRSACKRRVLTVKERGGDRFPEPRGNGERFGGVEIRDRDQEFLA